MFSNQGCVEVPAGADNRVAALSPAQVKPARSQPQLKACTPFTHAWALCASPFISANGVGMRAAMRVCGRVPAGICTGKLVGTCVFKDVGAAWYWQEGRAMAERTTVTLDKELRNLSLSVLHQIAMQHMHVALSFQILVTLYPPATSYQLLWLPPP